MLVCPECGESYGEGSRTQCGRDGAALMDSRGDPLLGALVGSYRVACLVGVGGMGMVYKGVHPSIGSRVAIKVLSGDFTRESSLVERFFAEARAVNLIRHENIVNVLDLAWLPDGRPYIVMEYLDGNPLSAILTRRGKLPLGSLVSLTAEVAEALRAAHEKGIVHRDLKPDNIYVTPGGRAKVLDFGVAKLRPDHLSSLHAATATGSILGTPFYMSPEQALGRRVDHRSDLYAVGIILFEGATGRLPFMSGAVFEVLKQQIEATPPAPQSLRADLPPALAEVILRSLEKDPDRRYASAHELLNALNQAAQWLPRDSFGSLGAESFAAFSPAAGRPAALAAAAGYPAGSQVAGGSMLASGLSSQGGYSAAVSYGSLNGHASGSALYAPTSPGYVRTLRGTVGSRAWLGWVLGGLGVLALAAVGLTVAGVWLWARTLRRQMPGNAAVTSSAASHDRTTQRSSWSSGDLNTFQQKPVGFDPLRILVWDHFVEAEQRAQKVFPDARLVRIDVTGTNREGIVNAKIKGDHGSSALFRWRSPRLSERPADLPLGAKLESNCLYYYNVDGDGVSSYTVAQGDCDELVVPRPRCTLQQVWVKAEARGAPRGNYIGDLSYYAWDKDPARWYVRIGSFSQFLPDDC